MLNFSNALQNVFDSPVGYSKNKQSGNRPAQSGEILGKDYKTHKRSDSGEIFTGTKDQKHKNGLQFRIDMKNKGAYNDFLADNSFGLKNSHYVVEADKNDSVDLAGKGWKKDAENYRDTRTGKTGDLYKDDKGNEVLVCDTKRVNLNVQG